jgi:hypothetical protein
LDAAEARRVLWARYDAGETTADELEARLRLLDRAGDERTVTAALDAPVPLRRRRGARRLGAAVMVVTLVVAVVAGVVLAFGGDDSAAGPTGLPVGVETTIVVGAVPAGPAPPPDCPQAELADDPTDPAANPALLSEPPFLPEGYQVDDDDAIEPGTDPDISMSVAAGDPLPVEIRARVLDGDLAVRMRTFRYSDDAASADAAVAAALSGCSFSGERFDVPDRPEIGGTIVSGPIPTTVFAGWRLGDRRFIVAVEPGTDEPDELEAAKDLAGAIAAAELDAARNPPPPPAP